MIFNKLKIMLIQKLAIVFYSCCILICVCSFFIGYMLFLKINLIAKLLGLPWLEDKARNNKSEQQTTQTMIISLCIVNILIVLFNLWFTHTNRIDKEKDYSFKIPLLNFIIFIALFIQSCIVGYLTAFLIQSSSSYGPGPFDTFLVGTICSFVGYAVIIIQSHDTFIRGWYSLKKILNVLATIFITTGLTSLVWFLIQSKELVLMFQQTNYWTMGIICTNIVAILVEWWYIQSRNCNMNQSI